MGLADSQLMQAARSGATVGSARSSALRSRNLDEMLDNLVAFGWRPMRLPAGSPGEKESVARVCATASVHKKVVTGTGDIARSPPVR